MPNWSTLLEDNSGGFSAMRLGFLLWLVGVLAVWIFQSVSTQTVVQIDSSVVTIVGLLAGSKAVQRFGEEGN